jgi:hypothetical protein
MGWAVGWDSEWQRDVGYGVPSICDQPGCDAKIDRGLAYVCGGDPFGGEHGCGLYFCSEVALTFFADGTAVDVIEEDSFGDDDGDWAEVCERCSRNEQPFEPTSDTDEWIRWKLTDESWQPWRDENPFEVSILRTRLGGVIPGSGVPVEPWPR